MLYAASRHVLKTLILVYWHARACVVTPNDEGLRII